MAKLDERMELIGSAITSQAHQESRSIIEKANTLKQNELAAFEEHLIEKMFGEVQPQTRAVRQKAIKDKAQAEVKAHRDLLIHREESTTIVFAQCRARLQEYSGTPAYKAALLDDLRPWADRWDHATTTVSLRKEDMDFAPDIQAILPGCQVAESTAIKLGGFTLLNREASIAVNETLDNRLEEQKPWFLQHCGMQVL